jgi:hypothetical protein
MAILKAWILESVPFHKAHHFAAYTAVLSVCPLALPVEPADRILQYRNVIYLKATKEL